MIEAPFSGTDASSVLAPLAVVFIALSGVFLMIRAPRFAARALALGALLAVFAGIAAQVFQ